MVTRSATATIAGYIYQFDYTIKCLLNLSNDNDLIDIENIEIIDTGEVYSSKNNIQDERTI
jgi:hypothetical protein